jgi:hypothetical protein
LLNVIYYCGGGPLDPLLIGTGWPGCVPSDRCGNHRGDGGGVTQDPFGLAAPFGALLGDRSWFVLGLAGFKVRLLS